jgi:hypothetical protein
MRTCLNGVIALAALLLGSPGMASETRVIINLSDQRVSLVQQGRITLVSPIASGKPGWSTPRGNFSIFNKDIDHRSRSFGSVFDAYGRMVNSNATPGSYVPRGGHYRPAPMPYFMGCTPVTFQDIPRPTDACECREISLPCFSSGSKLERQSRSSAARTTWLVCEGPFRYCPPVHM